MIYPAVIIFQMSEVLTLGLEFFPLDFLYDNIALGGLTYHKMWHCTTTEFYCDLSQFFLLWVLEMMMISGSGSSIDQMHAEYMSVL
jgi:hypothetical protein